MPGLSAGERQLISIARALLADPRILVLDEATSNIDRPTEVLIEQALDRLLKGRTSIIIAHRLSTVRRADEILVVENGQVIQRGSERELLAVDGPFRRLAAHARGRRAGARGRRLVLDGGLLEDAQGDLDHMRVELAARRRPRACARPRGG